MRFAIATIFAAVVLARHPEERERERKEVTEVFVMEVSEALKACA